MGLSVEDLEHDLMMFKREAEGELSRLADKIDARIDNLAREIDHLIGDLDELRKKVTPTGA